MNNKELIRVLQIPGKMDYGGVSAVIMNYYRHTDKSKLQFDFAVNEDCSFPQQEELNSSGSKIYRVSSLKNVIKYVWDIYKVVKNGHYHIVHAHMNSLNIFPLFAARLGGADVRICHNHSTDAEGEFIRNVAKNIFKRFSKIFPTHYAACSEHAADWLYGKKFCERNTIKIIRNGIELDRFAFNNDIRSTTRNQLGIGDECVIGSVGRFVFQKNYNLLIDIFYELHRKNKKTILLLVGEGELQEEVKAKVKKYGMEDAVIFTGAVKDTSKMYQAMDVFALTSRYEGLPVTTIEAQANGLYCVVSNAVPEEAIITDNIEKIENYFDITEWTMKLEKSRQRTEKALEMMKEYDICKCVEELFEYYMMKENCCL